MISSSSRSFSEAPWFYASLLCAFIVGLPVLAVFYLSLFPSENIWPHLVDTVLPEYVINTAVLMLGVGFGVFALGTGSAWLIAMYDFPGKRYFSWMLLLPFAVPSYVIAYVYTDLFEYAGVIQSTLRELFGWENASDYWFPEIRSMGGAITMMTLVLYPYVYMLARASFMEQSATLYQVTRSLGKGSRAYFWQVSLPIARPAIAVGLALALMETINDFGTVDYFAVRTLTAGLYDTWLNMSNIGGAAQIASLMLIVVVCLIYFERRARTTHQNYTGKSQGEKHKPTKLKGIQAVFAMILALVPVFLGFGLPVLVLSIYAIQYFDVSWSSDFVEYAFNSFYLAFGAALVTLILGLLLSYSKRLNRSKSTAFFVQFSSLGYAIPGAVLAVGVIIPFAAVDNFIDDQARSLFGVSTGLLLSGTAFAILFAYTVRFLAVAAGSIESSMDGVTRNMDMAARSLGLTQFETLIKVHIPIIRRGLLTAALVVFVDCMKELPATLILRPFNFETLATHVYQFASDELLEQCSLAALVIVLVGILPVIILDKSIHKS